MSAIGAQNRKVLVTLALEGMDRHLREDGSIDKDSLQREIRKEIEANPYLLPGGLGEFRERAVDFAIHEFVKWTIRNRKPDGSVKGKDSGGRRAVYSVPTDGRRFVAKRFEDLSLEDLQKLREYFDRTMTSSFEEYERISEEIARRGSEE